MLGVVRPTAVDPALSSVAFDDEGLELQIVHSGPDYFAIWATIGHKDAIVGAGSAHEHFFAPACGRDRSRDDLQGRWRPRGQPPPNRSGRREVPIRAHRLHLGLDRARPLSTLPIGARQSRHTHTPFDRDASRVHHVDPNTFTGAALDRAEDGRRRDDEWIAAQVDHPRARTLVAGSGGVAVGDGHLMLTPLGDAPGKAGAVLLGLDDEGPVFAVDEDAPPAGEGRPGLVGAGGRRGEPAPEVEGRVGLRNAALVLPQAEGGLAAYAAALLNWHRSHRFCANCGAPTDPAEGGVIRRCERCGSEHHPRVDPVVIMLVTDGPDRVLLGRQAVWPEGRYSALAGFVTAGESLEEAVVREVEEEAGVEVGEPVYVSSQPWPFPASLMLGFEAPWAGGEPARRDEELQDVRWFTREQVATAAREGRDDWEQPPPGERRPLLLPPRSAIARRLIERWLTR